MELGTGSIWGEIEEIINICRKLEIPENQWLNLSSDVKLRNNLAILRKKLHDSNVAGHT